MRSEQGDDQGDDEASGTAPDKGLGRAAHGLLVIVRSDEMCYENLVPVSKAYTQDDGEHGEVRTKNAGGHGERSEMNDHRGDENLEKLEADRFRGCGKPDANPVPDDGSGTPYIENLCLVADFVSQDAPEDSARKRPGKSRGECDAFDVHFRKSEQPV